MITATILLVGGLSGSCGITIGCLMRQPEINKLRKMVKQLNKKNSELRKLLDEQMQMIEVLQDEIRAYKFYNFIKKRETRKELRRKLVAQYALKEYCSILLFRDKNREVILDDEQNKFFNIMDGYLSGKNVSKEDQNYMDRYIIAKYNNNIRKCEKWDYHQLIA